VHFTYRRYLENHMREQFDFGGTSIILRFRSKTRPGAEKREAAKADTRKPLDRKFSGDKPAKRFGVKKIAAKKPVAGKPGARKPPAAGRKRKPSRDIR